MIINIDIIVPLIVFNIYSCRIGKTTVCTLSSAVTPSSKFKPANSSTGSMVSNVGYNVFIDTQANDDGDKSIEGEDIYDVIKEADIKQPCISDSQNHSDGRVQEAEEYMNDENGGNDGYDFVYEHYDFPLSN